MTIADVLADTGDKMRKAVTHTQTEFSSVRTGRAAPALVEKLIVDYYGADVPLQQLAGTTVPEARTLIISPYDRGALGSIEKALRNSDLGVNPSNDGVVIRITFPPLSAERRKQLVKVVKTMGEDGKVAIRNLRRQARSALEELEREGEVSSDEVDRATKELEKLTSEHVGGVDTAFEHKERELLEV